MPHVGDELPGWATAREVRTDSQEGRTRKRLLWVSLVEAVPLCRQSLFWVLRFLAPLPGHRCAWEWVVTSGQAGKDPKRKEALAHPF